MSNLIEIGALWRSRTGGKSIATGSLGKGGARLVLLENDKRGNDNWPDFKLFVAPFEKRDEEKPNPSTVEPAGTYGGAYGGEDDDDIPF